MRKYPQSHRLIVHITFETFLTSRSWILTESIPTPQYHNRCRNKNTTTASASPAIMTKGTKGSFSEKHEEEGGVSVSASAVLSGDKPVTVSAEVAESITSTNADSVIFTPDGSTPEETTPRPTFALPFRPAIPMDSVIEGLSSLEIKETQQGSQQQPDRQASPEPPISKSKKRRMKRKQRKKRQLEEELKKKQEQGASIDTKPQPAPVAIAKEKKPSTKVTPTQVINLFDEYFHTRSLANWQRLCIDLGFEDKNISTVTQCRKVCFAISVFLASSIVPQSHLSTPSHSY